jgi:hypothetical protein
MLSWRILEQMSLDRETGFDFQLERAMGGGLRDEFKYKNAGVICSGRLPRLQGGEIEAADHARAKIVRAPSAPEREIFASFCRRGETGAGEYGYGAGAIADRPALAR